MKDNYLRFLTYVLNEIAIPTGMIVNSGGIWRLAKPFSGLEKLATRTFNTSSDAVTAIATHYVDLAENGDVSGVDFNAFKKVA